MAETIYLAVTGNDSTAVHGDINYPYASLATALSSISAHDTTVILRDGTHTLLSTEGHLDTSNTTGHTGDPEGAPNLVHVVRSNVTIQAENEHKATIDCQNTQGAIWFMTNWADGLTPGTVLGINGNLSFETGVGDTKVNNIKFSGLIIANFKKTSGRYNFSETDASVNGNGANFINVGTGFIPAAGQAGVNVTLDKCIIRDCMLQSANPSKDFQMGLVGVRQQRPTTGARVDDMAYVSGGSTPNATYKAPGSWEGQGGQNITYTQCLFKNIGSDPDDLVAGTYGLFNGKGGRKVDDTADPSETVFCALSTNLINNTFYSTKAAGEQYSYLFSQYVSPPHNPSNSYNIVNNIIYNLGDSIDLSFQGSGDWTLGERGLSVSTVNPATSSANVYSNNSIYGITNGTLPLTMEFSTASGNLVDTDPQILAPSEDRWGLRQNSPCKGTGISNPTLF
jgi:hypothetical protein